MSLNIGGIRRFGLQMIIPDSERKPMMTSTKTTTIKMKFTASFLSAQDPPPRCS